MAMSATISVSPDPVLVNQTCTATITVSNSGASAVTVQSIQLHAYLTGASEPTHLPVAYGQPNLLPGATTSVDASGSTVFPVNLTFFAPSTGILSAGSGTFDVTAYIKSSDGSQFSPTADTVTVNYLPFPTSQQ